MPEILCLHAIWLRKELLSELDGKEQRWRGPFIGRIVPKQKYNTARNNLKKVIDDHNEMFLAHVRRTEHDP